MTKHAEWVSEQIDHDSIIKLAIITWSFGASLEYLSQQLFDFLACPEVDNLDPTLHTYSKLVEIYLTIQQFSQKVTDLLDTIKYDLRHQWNVLWKFMPLENLTAIPQGLGMAMDIHFSCKFHWYICSRSLNDNSSYPGQPYIYNINASLVLVEESCILKSECICYEGTPNYFVGEVDRTCGRGRIEVFA